MNVHLTLPSNKIPRFFVQPNNIFGFSSHNEIVLYEYSCFEEAVKQNKSRQVPSRYSTIKSCVVCKGAFLLIQYRLTNAAINLLSRPEERKCIVFRTISRSRPFSPNLGKILFTTFMFSLHLETMSRRRTRATEHVVFISTIT